MITITPTQFWIVSAILVVAMAIIGYLVSKYAMKATDMKTNMMYAGISALIGVAVSTALWFTIVDKKPPTYTSSPKKNVVAAQSERVNIDVEGRDTSLITPEKYISNMTQSTNTV